MSFFSDVIAVPLPHAPDVTLASCRFDAAAYDDALYGRFDVTMADSIRTAVVKRKAEYLAGRYLGNLLLQRHSLPSGLASGRHRQPLWPEGWTGSITHTHDAAIVAIAPASHVPALGIDLEYWLSDRVAADIHANIIDPHEAAVLAAWDFPRALTLAFSAKESVFKALYPSVGRYFDFGAARVIAVDAARAMLTIEIVEALSERIVPGLRLRVHFSSGARGVLTVCSDDCDSDCALGDAAASVLA